jgi:hypothetical protein
MMFLTAKVDFKKIAIVGIALIAAIVALILIFTGGKDAQSTAAPTVSNNDARVDFLKGYGWDVAASPMESGQVRIPEVTTDVYARYNDLQKSQGYDLTPYAGKTVMRYVYKINNYPGASDPVLATVLVYKNQIIGGDVTDTSAQGVVSGFRMPQS